jgi:uncharacterized RDD family membrane protein YckC
VVGSLELVADVETQSYPGQRLGLPQDGAGAIASWRRRLVAIAVDWAASWLVAIALFPATLTDEATTAADLLLVPLVAVAQSVFFIALLGGSFGHVACRMVVVRLDRRPLGLVKPLLRSVLVYLVIPPLVFNQDNRGLHDLAAGTVLLNR